MKSILAVLLLLATFSVSAEETIELVPSDPAPGQPVVARIWRAGCRWLPETMAPERIGSLIRFTVWREDTCDSIGPHQRDYPLGPLDRGEYVVELRTCGYDLLRGFSCRTLDAIPLSYAGTARPVPILDLTGSLLFVALLLGLARRTHR